MKVARFSVFFISYGLSLSLAMATSAKMLDRRSVQSQAVCIDAFSWMSNSENQNPCLVAAWLLSQCAGGDWTMPQLPNAQSHYGTPGFGNVQPSLCSCAWATYNTIQACAVCQGESFDTAMLTWDAYNPNCTSSFDSAPLPWSSDVVIPQDTAIPFWAETDPTKWEDSTFNPTAAQSLAEKNKPDLTEADRNSKKSSHAGAIAGGVVGGVAVLLAICVALFFWRRRRRRRIRRLTMMSSASRVPFHPMHATHAHTPSDPSTMLLADFSSSSPGLGAVSMAGSISQKRPAFHQHTSSSVTGASSVQNLSYASHPHSPELGMLPPGAAVPYNAPPSAFSGGFGSRGQQSSLGHAHTLSNQSNVSSVPSGPQDVSQSMVSFGADAAGPPEGVIVPFILPSVEQSQQQQEDTSMVTSTPVRKAERRNPPAYSPTPTPVGSPEERMFGSGAGAGSISQRTRATAGDSDVVRAAGAGMEEEGEEEEEEMPVMDPTIISTSSVAEGRRQADQYGYPVDRKG